MKIPNKLRIGGIEYKIILRPMENQCGEYDAVSQTISINSSLKQEIKEETLVHEILHAINNELDEREIEFLAQSIYQVFKGNKIIH